MSEYPASRRETLRRGALAAGALAAGGLLRPALAAAQATDDEDLRDFLVEAIGLEQVTVLAYSTAADAAADAEVKRFLEDFRDQEQAHANALLQALDELGFDPPDAPDSPTDTAVFDGVEGLSDEAATRLSDDLGRIDQAKSDADYLELLDALESEQLSYYLSRGPALDSVDLSTTSAEIAGCQAQHLVALRIRSTRTVGAAVGTVASAAADAGHDASSQSR